jgi:hypothetical protein
LTGCGPAFTLASLRAAGVATPEPRSGAPWESRKVDWVQPGRRLGKANWACDRGNSEGPKAQRKGPPPGLSVSHKGCSEH